MKTAQEARKGDRVWVKRYPTRHLEEVVIDNPEHWTESDDFNEDWGYLADNETVIGGHVRKHSAADKPKRTARDAKVGDDVWVRDGTSHVVFEGGVKFIDTATISPRGYGLSIVVGATPYIRDQCTFGTDWGFWEDRPQAQEAKPEQPAISPFEAAIQEHVDSQPEQPSPHFGNVKLLIKSKGLDWVKANLPDAWRAYKDAGLEKARQEGDKLAKPGILAGKHASPWG